MAIYEDDNDYYYKEILPYIADADKDKIKNKLIESQKTIIKETEDEIGRDFREKFSNYVLRLFIGLNIFVGFIILVAFGLDEYLICHDNKDISSRLVTPQVLMMLIGATATQIAVAFGLLSKYIFKVFDKSSDKKTPTPRTRKTSVSEN